MPASAAIAAISSSGCKTPVSLLAAMIEIKVVELSVFGTAMTWRRRSSQSTCPSGKTLANLILACAARTESCSVRVVMIWRYWLRTRLFASVPPLVKTTSRAWHPASPATASRASSTFNLAARPKPCTEDGFAGGPITSRMAIKAASRNGAVALLSR